jgi:hypothetical protein
MKKNDYIEENNKPFSNGITILKDEPYVLNGDVIIKTYYTLFNRRTSILLMLSKLPPTEVARCEEYIMMIKHLNMIMYNLLHSVPLLTILQSHDDTKQTETKTSGLANDMGRSFEQLLEQYHLKTSNIDERTKKSGSID